MANRNIFEKKLFYKYFHQSFNIDTGINVSVLGYEKCSKTKPQINLNKNCYVMHIITKGKGALSINNESYELGEGDIFIIKPNTKISYKQETKNPWEYIWFEFYGGVAKKIISCIDAKENLIIKTTKLETIKHLFKSAVNKLSDCYKNSESILIDSTLLNMFSLILSEQTNLKECKELTKKEIKVSEIISFIESNYSNSDLTIKSIADKFYFTQSYFTRLFKETTGVTPIQFIIKIRMTKACELLSHKSFTIAQIAENVGFKNQFYFSKEFKKYYGITPSQYLSDN